MGAQPMRWFKRSHMRLFSGEDTAPVLKAAREISSIEELPSCLMLSGGAKQVMSFQMGQALVQALLSCNGTFCTMSAFRMLTQSMYTSALLLHGNGPPARAQYCAISGLGSASKKGARVVTFTLISKTGELSTITVCVFCMAKMMTA